MTSIAVLPPYQLFTDVDGTALDGGFIWVGAVDQDPKENPIAVYWDETLTIPAEQPIRTQNGIPMYAGSPSNIYTSQDFSLLIEDKNNQLVSWVPSSTSIFSLQSELAGASGSSLIGFNLNAVGSSTMTLLQKIKQVCVSVKDFGAIGNGLADDTAAIQNAWNYCSANGLSLKYPDGKYRVTNTLFGKPLVHFGEGNPEIIFDTFDGKSGFTFLSADTIGAIGGITGVQLVAKGSNGGTAVEMPKDSSQYFTYFTRWIFNNITCRGYTRNTDAYSVAWDYGFAKWFRLSDCFGVDFEYVNIMGQFNIKISPVGQLADVGIEIDAAGACLTARIRKVSVGPIHTAMNVGDRAFFSLSEFDFIGTYRGIYQTGTVIFNEPKIFTGNINAQETGIYVSGSDTRDFNGVTIRRHSAGWKGATHDWKGIHLIDASNFAVDQCTIQPDHSAGDYAGTSYAIALENCALGTLNGNYIGANNDRGITAVNCTGVNIDNTISAQSSASDILFRFTDNTRRVTVGQYSLVSSFSGTVLSKDETIVQPITMINDSYDIQSNSTINVDYTRVNAAADSKKWRTSVSTTSMNRQALTDAGAATNFELVTRTGAAITGYELRSTDILLNAATTRTLALRPFSDNNRKLGDATFRWSEVYAGSGTINTSDEREKSFEAVNDAEKAVAIELKSMIRKFRFNDSISRKGDGARIHFGVGAQSVAGAFRKHGLNPESYALFCYDEWDSIPEIVDEDGVVTQPAVAAGNRFGIRYDELFAFIISSL